MSKAIHFSNPPKERAGIEPALVRVFTNWLFDSLERIFAEAAPWANPIVGNILECGAGGDAGIRVADLGVVLETARANIFHGGSSHLIANGVIVSGEDVTEAGFALICTHELPR